MHRQTTIAKAGPRYRRQGGHPAQHLRPRRVGRLQHRRREKRCWNGRGPATPRHRLVVSATRHRPARRSRPWCRCPRDWAPRSNRWGGSQKGASVRLDEVAGARRRVPPATGLPTTRCRPQSRPRRCALRSRAGPAGQHQADRKVRAPARTPRSSADLLISSPIRDGGYTPDTKRNSLPL